MPSTPAPQPPMPVATPTLAMRFAALPAPPLEAMLQLVRGGWKDYQALASHHYKAHRPATATRVLVLRHTQPTVVSRFLGQPSEQHPTPVAVLVESLPSLACTMRELALQNRYRSMGDLWERAQRLNAEIRCISRVIVHPTWRGLGLAHQLVRHALQTATTIYTEALAAMGKVHPFFEKAGMTAYPRPTHEPDARLIAALAHVGLAPTDLALLGRVQIHLAQLPEKHRALLLKELHRWYRAHAQRSHPDTGDPLAPWRCAQTCLLSEPVYYLHDNRRLDSHKQATDETDPSNPGVCSWN